MKFDTIPDDQNGGFDTIPDNEQPSMASRFGAGLKKGFMRTGEPTNSTAESIGQTVGRYGPAMAGSLAAGALTGGAGLLPAVASQFLGAGAGEAYGQLASRVAGGKSPKTSSEAAKDIASTGAEAAATEAGLGVAGKLAKALRPGAEKIGAALLRVGPAIPEKSGKAALKDLALLARAKSPDTVGQAYQAFERYAGLKGLEETTHDAGRLIPSPTELESMVVKTANRVKAADKTVTPQDLYLASQAASKLKLSAKLGEPQAQMAASSAFLGKDKEMIDQALEKAYPEYKHLRTDAFESKVAQQFKSWLPLNKNQSPNALRSVLAGNEALKALERATLGGAVGGYAGGKEGAAGGVVAGLAAPLLISPKLAGLAIRGANRASQAFGPAASVARKLAPGAMIPLISSQGQKIQAPAELAQKMIETGQWQVIQ